jgi:hypothetical protein
MNRNLSQVETISRGLRHLTSLLWIPDPKTPNGIGEVPLTTLAADSFRSQMVAAGEGHFLFPGKLNATGHLKTLHSSRLAAALAG